MISLFEEMSHQPQKKLRKDLYRMYSTCTSGKVVLSFCYVTYSTVTDLARLRGLSTSLPRNTEMV